MICALPETTGLTPFRPSILSRDGVRVGGFQRDAAAGAGRARRRCGCCPGMIVSRLVPRPCELTADRGAGALAERDDGDDRRDADDDAERRQDAAALVGAQRPERRRDRLQHAQRCRARGRHLGQQGERIVVARLRRRAASAAARRWSCYGFVSSSCGVARRRRASSSSPPRSASCVVIRQHQAVLEDHGARAVAWRCPARG